MNLRNHLNTSSAIGLAAVVLAFFAPEHAAALAGVLIIGNTAAAAGGDGGAAAAAAAAAGGDGKGGDGKAAAAAGANGDGKAAAGAGGGDGSASSAPEWAKGAKDDTIRLIGAKGWDKAKTPAEALDAIGASYVQLETKINAKGVILPTKDSKPEEVQAFHRALGVPEKAVVGEGGYDLGEFKLPERWDATIRTPILEAMHKEGATPGVVRATLQTYAKIEADAMKARDLAAQAQPGKTAEALTEKLGGKEKFEAGLERANRAFRVGFGDELDAAKQLRLQDGTFVFDHPAFVGAFIRLSEGMGADPRMANTKIAGQTGGMTVVEARARRDAVKADPEKVKAFNDKGHAQHKTVVAEMDALDEIILRAENPKAFEDDRK